ncbi:hypothetical protein [Streptomyces sp. NTH33]|uniref:hypothetical protein n=1 Tax=Streptomyces sp. NTH33 TaxID=1735453 RepID=UPI003F903D39
MSVGSQPPTRPDCTILTEPVTFLLMALGRRDQWSAAAQGRVFARGRKFWLAPRFPALFKAP